MLGALLYFLYLSVITVSDILRTGALPYYDPTYIVLGLLTGALIGVILGIVAALVNSAAMALLISVFRLRSKSANVPRKAFTFTLTLVSGLAMLSYCLMANLPSFLTTIFPDVSWDWLFGAIIPALLAACWAWRVSGKAPIIALQS